MRLLNSGFGHGKRKALTCLSGESGRICTRLSSLMTSSHLHVWPPAAFFFLFFMLRRPANLHLLDYDEPDFHPKGHLWDVFAREVFPKFRRDFASEVDMEFEGVGERLKTKVYDAVHTVMLKIVREVQNGQGLDRASSTPSSPSGDSGIATPEPPSVALPVAPNLDGNIFGMFDNTLPFVDGTDLLGGFFEPDFGFDSSFPSPVDGSPVSNSVW